MGEQLWKELHRVGWQQWSFAGELLLSLRAEGVWGRTASWRVRKAGSEISAETLPTPIQVIPTPHEITQLRDVHAKARQDTW